MSLPIVTRRLIDEYRLVLVSEEMVSRSLHVLLPCIHLFDTPTSRRLYTEDTEGQIRTTIKGYGKRLGYRRQTKLQSY